MRRNQYRIRLAYFICISLIVALGFVGGSYAIWSDSHFITNKINTGFLLADAGLELPDDSSIIITEKYIVSSANNQEEDKDAENEQNNDNKEDKNVGSEQNNNSQIESKNSDNTQNSSQICITEYSCNYNRILFTIENAGTVPLKLVGYDINLNSVDISHIYSVEFEEYNYINENLTINENTRGYIQIDYNKLEKLAGLIKSDNDNIVLTLYFRQSNLLNGGWTQEESINIRILKNIEIIENKSDTVQDVNGGAGNES